LYSATVRATDSMVIVAKVPPSTATSRANAIVFMKVIMRFATIARRGSVGF